MLGDITQFGVAGLSVFLMWKLANGQMHTLTRSMKELSETIRELKEYLRHGK